MMQFKNPIFLYFFFLLLIPILIHLFQLRRFKEVPFTNVALLKSISIQSRKSSQLKKWIVLCLRLLSFSALILAFAQPFLPASSEASQKTEYTVYLDNSFSMQMPSKRGNLLKEAKQELIESIPENAEIQIFTNSTSYVNLDAASFKNEVLATSFTSKQLTFENAILKAKQLQKNPNATQKIVLVSDFQLTEDTDLKEDKLDKDVYLLQVQPESKINFSIADLDFDEKEQILNIQLLASTETKEQIQLSVLDGNTLLAKQQVAFEGNASAEIEISLTEEAVPYGIVQIEDEALQYDNRFYFSINPSPKIKVLSIYEEDDSFLSRIFNKQEFEFQSTAFQNLDYAKIKTQNMIVLNGVKRISNQLKMSLTQFANDGGSVVIIPHQKANLNSYNEILRELGLPNFANAIINEQKITSINFDHPLLENVFSERVSNFEYPLTRSHFDIKIGSSAVLRYADQKTFLASAKQHYVFAASLISENSNFTTSPLIVPIFYNMARNSVLKQSIFDYTDKANAYLIPVNLPSDKVVQLEKGEQILIPQQQKFSQNTQINTAGLSLEVGTYQVKANEKVVQHVSFNYPRTQSNLTYLQTQQWKNKEQLFSISSFFEKESRLKQIDEYWKVLLIFALIFLTLEILALRYLK